MTATPIDIASRNSRGHAQHQAGVDAAVGAAELLLVGAVVVGAAPSADMIFRAMVPVAVTMLFAWTAPILVAGALVLSVALYIFVR